MPTSTSVCKRLPGERAEKEAPVTKAEAMAAALNEFLDVSWEVEAAAVISPDGLPMASALPPDVEEDRLAAMSASLLTLGERAAEGLDKGELAQVLVEGEQGYVLLMSAGPDALLVAVMSREAKVGLVLFEMRRAAASIAAVMDGSYRQVAPPVADEPAAEPPDESPREPVIPAAPSDAAFPRPAEGVATAPPAPEVAAPAPPEREPAAPPASDPSYAEAGGAWTEPVEDLRIETPPSETRWSEPIETSQEPASWSPVSAEATAEPPAWSSPASEEGSGESQAPAWESPSEPEGAAPPPPAADADSGEQGTQTTQERGSLWDRASGRAAPESERTADSERAARGWRHWRSSHDEDFGEQPGSGESTSGPVSWLDSSEQEDDKDNPSSAPTWK